MTFVKDGKRIGAWSFNWAGQILGIEPFNIYRNDGMTPDKGLSSLILHEVGHSLGLPHPHDCYTIQNSYYELGYGSLFTDTLMTYFHEVSQFSGSDTNTLGHPTSDYYLAPAEWYASELKAISSLNSSIEYLNAISILQHAQETQLNWNYSSSIVLAREALRLLKDLYESIPPPTTSGVESSSSTSLSTTTSDSTRSSNEFSSDTSVEISPFQLFFVIVSLGLFSLSKKRFYN
jgi:hypothetical protein